ncbi:MAG: 3-hydroxyacyl-ACP dehydratase FabZ [Elusimicrobia bacterium]|nr:3-hydroxyacyl-ACP dehydratase FabZ [Elusimicrobiota bacterium]
MNAEAAAPSPFAAAPVRALDIAGVKKAIPHRYPFLLIDKIQVIQEDKYCIGIKMVTANEHFFEGHFPGQPVMPGVLIVESMAQTACAMLLSKGGFENKIAFFMGIDEAKFRAPVTPGCVLSHRIEILRLGRAGKFKGESYVDGKMVAEATMTFALVDKAQAA